MKKSVRMARFIDCYIPINTCNLRCPYCYITQSKRWDAPLPKVTYATETIIHALSQKRLGGVCHFNICGNGCGYHRNALRRRKKMSGYEKKDVQNLFTELNGYEKKGVDITLNGLAASPMQVVQAHILREDVIYMRDYVMNEKGDIKELCFTDVIIQK